VFLALGHNTLIQACVMTVLQTVHPAQSPSLELLLVMAA
jgi:hypothetical protein